MWKRAVRARWCVGLRSPRVKLVAPCAPSAERLEAVIYRFVNVGFLRSDSDFGSDTYLFVGCQLLDSARELRWRFSSVAAPRYLMLLTIRFCSPGYM